MPFIFLLIIKGLLHENHVLWSVIFLLVITTSRLHAARGLEMH